MATTPPTVFVIGGTGAQGIPVIQGLVHDKAYKVRALTRDPSSARSEIIKALGDVELLKGTFADEETLHQGFHGCQYAFVNIDGFNSGEKTEMYWAIRAYEIALEEGIKFFVYGNLDYAYKKSGYDPRCRAGHYDGKDRVVVWILQQTKSNKDRMGNIWRMSGGNRGVVQRDYTLLDRIHPNRIRSVEQWFRIEDDKGGKTGRGGLWERVQNLQPILKIVEDGRKGLL